MSSTNDPRPHLWRGAVIVNAASGGGNNGAIAHQMAEMLDAHGIEPTVSVVDGHDVPGAARRAVERGVSLVVAGGGDGTISTVASALVGSETVLGVLPLGTLNHFAKDLRIPLNPIAAAHNVIAGRPVCIDVGELNGRAFINNASLGLYPRMVWERERERRTGRGKWTALAVAARRIWHQYRRVRVVIRMGSDQRVVRTPFVLIGNNEYELDGTRLGARQRLDGGCLQVSMAPGMTRVELLRMLVAALAGRFRGQDRLDALCVPTLAIEARRRRIGVSLDGELLVVDTPLLFRSRPKALRVLVPAS